MAQGDAQQTKTATELTELELENHILKLDLQLKEKELQSKQSAEQGKGKGHRWLYLNPIVVASIAALVGFLSNAYVISEEGRNALELETQKLQSSIQIEREERQTTAIFEAIKTGNREDAAINLKFFLEIGLIDDENGLLSSFLEKNQAQEDPEELPVLPANSSSTSPNPDWQDPGYEEYYGRIMDSWNSARAAHFHKRGVIEDIMSNEEEGLDLSWEDLSEANLSGAYLRGAILNGADLSGADLSDADLIGADLTWTILNTTILERAKYNKDTRWPRSFQSSMAGMILEE